MEEREILKRLQQQYPQLERFQSVGEVHGFIEQLKHNQELANPTLAKTIESTLSTLQTPLSPSEKPVDPTSPQKAPAIPGANLLSLALLPFISNRTELLENDGKFVSLKDKTLKEWRKNNPDKKGTSAELDYTYGSLDNPDAPSLHKDTEAAFREKYKNNPKVVKNLSRYDENKKKIYKNKKGAFRLGDDPAIRRYTHSIQEEAYRRFNLLRKKDRKLKYKEVYEKVEKARFQQFAQEFPEKAYAYSKDDSALGKKIKSGKEAHAQYKNSQSSQTLINRLPQDMRAQTAETLSSRLRQTQWPQSQRQQPSQQRPPGAPTPLPVSPPTTIPVRAVPRTSAGYGAAAEWKQETKRSTGLGTAATQKKQVFISGQNRGTGESTATQKKENRFRGSGIISRGINRFNKASSILQGVQNPKDFARSWAQDKASGYAKQQGMRLAGNAARVGSRLAMQGIASAASSLGGILGSIGGAAGGIGGVGAALIGGGALLFIILIVVIIVFFFGGPPKDPISTQIPGLTLRKQGPSQVANGENINYTISATYAGTYQIVITDTIPQNTTFVSATGVHTTQADTNGVVTSISWALKDQTASSGSQLLSFTVHPEKDDIIVKNRAIARVVGGGGGGPLPDPNATDFATLFRGQGRNVMILGDETSFVAKVIQSQVGQQYNLAGKEAQIHEIYQKASAKNVNPLIITALWGEESGFSLNGASLGCDPRGGGFPGISNQISCGVNTMANWMAKFDEASLKTPDHTVEIASDIPGNKCVYDDPFLYASEWYGPVCHAYDSNENYQPNMVKFFKGLLSQ